MADRVLVTGATGYLGRAVCAALAEAGFETLGTDLRYRAEMPCPVEVADLLDPTAAYRLLAGCDAVVHLANHPGISAGPTPQRVYAENVSMNAHVLQAAAELGVRRVVFASSVQAFAGDRVIQWDEDAGRAVGLERPSCLAYLPIDGQMPACPGNLYGLSKAAGEQMLRFYAGREPALSAVAVRFPYLAADSHLRRHRREGRRPGRIHGRPDEGFSFLFVEDAASLVAALLARPQDGYRCICPAAPRTTLDVPVAELVEKCFPGVPLRRAVEQLTGLVDISALAETYGWRPRRGRLWD